MISQRKMPIYWFNWPSNLGGADTKFVHTLWLLRGEYDITVVPNARWQLEQSHWREWLHGLGMKTALLEDLPSKLEGWGVSLCNGEFWAGGIAGRARKRGLKIAWSSEMMWHHPGEAMAAELGLINKVLYVSEVQRQALEPEYCGVPGVITGNYIAPKFFPWRDRTKGRRFEEFVIGRLSRPDPAKFPRDFPESYQRLRLKNPRYRVMAWSDEMGREHPKERFRGTWDLLPKETETQLEFLHALDLFVYDLREDFTESWGRAVVEAMLTGAVPLVTGHPRHHLKHLVPHGVGGFLCSTKTEWREHAQRLQKDIALRKKMAQAAREFAVHELCNAAKHRAAWREVFED